MTTFVRLLADKDKASNLLASCSALRAGVDDIRAFEVAPNSFRAIPGAPFAYWVSEAVRSIFEELPAFEASGRAVRQGMATADDFRFVRGWWEVDADNERWPGFSKGGAYSAFYADLYLVGNWEDDGKQIRNFFDPKTGKLNSRPQSTEFYRRPGLTWPLRARKFCPQALPADAVISVRGSGIFSENPLLYLGLFSSRAVDLLLRMLSGREGHPQYDMGDISALPLPEVSPEISSTLERLSLRGWFLKRTLDTTNETSHAFLLPAVLRTRLGEYVPTAIDAELIQIQTEIDDIAFDLYRFSEADRQAALGQNGAEQTAENEPEDEEEGDAESEVPPVDALLSWAVGVAFGRFDWRLATGERAAPAEPEPFDPLPAKSPGMLPDGAAPFHSHPGILVDDQGHPHDLARLIEEVLARVEVPVPEDVRRWLQRDFFAFHLQRYSKSRRKAPIYWPLATTTGSYTLWVYYPSLTSQTLYTAINDFVEPKLKHVGAEVTALRNKGSNRTRDDEKQFEALQAFELELIELRDTLLKLAPTYKPNHDDGVQISAAPLWPLFRHKPWQKVLKDTWEKLKKGDYDWAHLAMNYWPDRVREKCKTDKSLAIAHGLEDLYIEPEAAPKKTRGRKKTGGDE
ncbi:BREX-1 system adenine-specific DNA-methyltransferase PglX [Pseudomonas aeruginosa]|uniref:type II restriction endonuclease subunit M n=1 Tax=Pseudomonadota TaxID=1224 RepID=UPI0010679C57|nr:MULTISPECIES: type II restriction endonuclease subunit M [Pseudomonadota]MCK1895287.1 BREX-1 system adenine-specific DNA-methyltransferase PglX [Pseudomonas aeruginosa]MCS8146833.1 BREX-1 system adenine-specific DNA-methyltransferase PglX [Pseudomonas aeruginosa]MDE1544557.1 hypothetical protein [Dechloromonas agitata]NYU28634.1 type II restriction endonuclease subunit M [Pseudomonas aeruginosa]TEP00838.1 type II restriction endonuclease subunit M [Pseudomonas aeruginosa]